MMRAVGWILVIVIVVIILFGVYTVLQASGRLPVPSAQGADRPGEPELVWLSQTGGAVGTVQLSARGRALRLYDLQGGSLRLRSESLLPDTITALARQGNRLAVAYGHLAYHTLQDWTPHGGLQW